MTVPAPEDGARKIAKAIEATNLLIERISPPHRVSQTSADRHPGDIITGLAPRPDTRKIAMIIIYDHGPALAIFELARERFATRPFCRLGCESMRSVCGREPGAIRLDG